MSEGTTESAFCLLTCELMLKCQLSMGCMPGMRIIDIDWNAHGVMPPGDDDGQSNVGGSEQQRFVRG
jgi:hypothetical protein